MTSKRRICDSELLTQLGVLVSEMGEQDTKISGF